MNLSKTRRNVILLGCFCVLFFVVVLRSEPLEPLSRKGVVEPLDSEGRRHGSAIWHYTVSGETAEKALAGDYEHGKLNGEIVQWYRDGTLLSRARYIDGRQTGVAEVFYPSGQLHRRGHYADGRLDGLVEVYSKAGHLRKRIPYKHGQVEGVVEHFYASGAKRLELIYAAGQRQGPSPRWDEEGRLRRTVYFEDDKPVRVEDAR
jgi:antitoxin component YwqK of YwqJK toxin-antitoxin module